MITLDNYYFPEELERAITEFVNYYNNQRYHESLNNLIPAYVFYGREKKIVTLRQKIKKRTLKLRRSQNLKTDNKKQDLIIKNVSLNFQL